MARTLYLRSRNLQVIRRMVQPVRTSMKHKYIKGEYWAGNIQLEETEIKMYFSVLLNGTCTSFVFFLPRVFQITLTKVS